MTLKHAANYLAIRRSSGETSASRIFLSLNLKPADDRLLAYTTMEPSEWIEEGFIRDVTDLGHHGTGGFEMTLYPGSTQQLARAKDFIKKSYERFEPAI